MGENTHLPVPFALEVAPHYFKVQMCHLAREGQNPKQAAAPGIEVRTGRRAGCQEELSKSKHRGHWDQVDNRELFPRPQKTTKGLSMQMVRVLSPGLQPPRGLQAGRGSGCVRKAAHTKACQLN